MYGTLLASSATCNTLPAILDLEEKAVGEGDVFQQLGHKRAILGGQNEARRGQLS